MNKYRIAYIDEFEEDVRDFQRFASDYFEVVPIRPVFPLEELIVEILESHVRAVIVDHNLIEYDKSNTIDYYGNDVVDAINEILLDFPVFVLTSYDENAINSNEDARIVHEKNIMWASKEDRYVFESGIKFKRLVKAQIDKYLNRLEQSEMEVLKLLDKREKSPLTEQEEERLIKLDNMIEMSLSKKTIVPQELKKTSNAERLERILNKVDDLIKKFDDEKK